MPEVSRPDDAAWLRSNIRSLLELAGAPGTCRGCGRPIFWMRLKSGKTAPYTEHGLNHFADCTEAQRFRPKGDAPCPK